MRATRALTLAELLVYIAVGGLIGTLVTYNLIRVFAASFRLQQRADRLQQATVALQKMVSDIHNTTAEGLSLAPYPMLAVNPLQSVQGDGTQVWTGYYLLYYVDSYDRLVRLTWPPGNPAARAAETDITCAKLLSPARLVEVLNGEGARYEYLAQDVIQFTLTPNSRDSGLALPLNITLSLGDLNKPKENASMQRLAYCR